MYNVQCTCTVQFINNTGRPNTGRPLYWCVVCSEDERRGLTVVESDDVEDVKQLSLVLMDPLHVHIKDGVHVDLDIIVLLQILGKLLLVVLDVRTQGVK